MYLHMYICIQYYRADSQQKLSEGIHHLIEKIPALKAINQKLTEKENTDK